MEKFQAPLDVEIGTGSAATVAGGKLQKTSESAFFTARS